MRSVTTPFVLLAHCASSMAWAQAPRAPRRTIPPTVLVEVAEIESRFELALSLDCDAKRCFSKGCTYVDHAIADRPGAASLPGLGDDVGPGSVQAQAFLTKASCGFAYEGVEAHDVQVLARRLQAKLTSGWTVVTVQQQPLEALPAYLQDAPLPQPGDAPEPEDVPTVVEESWSVGGAGEQLWSSLLPHVYWMVALLLLTLTGTTLIWAWRRVGRESVEERALLAELERGLDEPTPDDRASDSGDESDEQFVARQDAAWRQRLKDMDSDAVDPEVQALIRQLLRAGDLPLLAKAVLRFPEHFPAAFPAGGDLAAAKLELASYLKTVDVEALPGDAAFFRDLNRHALSAALASQSDTQLLRSLREDFGTAGLAELLARLPALASARLFALAPADEQHELVRLLPEGRVSAMVSQLLRSNRMSEGDTAYLFEVLNAARNEVALPPAPTATVASDLGAAFDAAGALSVLLAATGSADRVAMFGRALETFHGSAPAWYRDIFFADMLFELPVEARADVLLDVDVPTLSAWMSLLDTHTAERLLDGAPTSLRASLGSSSATSRHRQLALAERARRDLARSFQRQLTAANVPFERVLRPAPGAVV